MKSRSASIPAALIIGSAFWTACEQPPAASQPASRPTASRPTSAPASAPATAPAESQPTSAPESKPASAPALPDYVKVLHRIDVAADPIVTAEIRGLDELILDTQNVDGMRLDRTELPLERNGSIVLRIDSQVIEWTSRYPLLELQKHENGEWRIIRRPAGP